MIVAGAWAEIAGRDGNRRELVEDLYAGPGATTLAKSDIITSFFLPDPSARCGSAHVKLGKRGSGTDIALAGVAVSVSIGEQGLVDECKIALASLGPTPLRALEAERALTGAAPTEETLGAVAEVAAGEARPIGDMRASAEYRTTLARVLTLRALCRPLPLPNRR